MGRGRAAELDSESSDFGSVMWRVSGPEDCAKQEAQSESTSRQRNVVRSESIVTSAEEQGGLRPSKQQANCTPGRDCDCTSGRLQPLFRVGRLEAQPRTVRGKHAAPLREMQSCALKEVAKGPEQEAGESHGHRQSQDPGHQQVA